MTLTEIVAELEKEARAPKLIIEAHLRTLEALVVLSKRLEALEFRTEALLDALEQIAGPQKVSPVPRQGRSAS